MPDHHQNVTLYRPDQIAAFQELLRQAVPDLATRASAQGGITLNINMGPPPAARERKRDRWDGDAFTATMNRAMGLCMVGLCATFGIAALIGMGKLTGYL